jgi:hypothetical protein
MIQYGTGVKYLLHLNLETEPGSDFLEYHRGVMYGPEDDVRAFKVHGTKVRSFSWREWWNMRMCYLERDLRHEDITKTCLSGGVPCSLYALSNVVNDYHVSFQRALEIAERGFVLLPNRRYLDTLDEKNVVLREGGYEDWTYDPFDFITRGFGVSHPTDLAFSLLSKDSLMGMRAVFNPRVRANHQWFIAYNVDLLPSIETYLTNENFYFKNISNVFRTSHGLDRNAVRMMRNRVLRLVGEPLSGWVHGAVLYNHQRYVVSISGHISGILLRAFYDLYDINRLFRFIEGSAKGGSDLEGLKYDGPWHSIFEWILGIYSVIPILDFVHFRSDHIDYMILSLLQIGRRVPLLMRTPSYTIAELRSLKIRVANRVKVATFPMIHDALTKLERFHKLGPDVEAFFSDSTTPPCK